MTFESLKDKALHLPMEPGVYLMRDKTGTVIYVGKAKRLKNRVSQYFQDTAAHTPKTRLMVSHIDSFEVIVAASEFEALVLECSQIKRYMPKYNILLKDDKGYPFVRLDTNAAYPRLSVVSKPAADRAEYFGPFGSRGVTNALVQALLLTLKLPDCSRVFPRDIGKDRPCLNYHMNQCAGWCQAGMRQEEYARTIEQARQLLLGNYRKVAEALRQQMLQASENLEFELAAGLRDRLNAVEALGKKQLVTAGRAVDMDVIGFDQTESKACFAVLHYSGGDLVDKEYQLLSVQEDPTEAVSSLVKQYYLNRGAAPGLILLPLEPEDAPLLQQLLGCKVHTPIRGQKRRLVELANANAGAEAERATEKEARVSASLQLLGRMLAMEPPGRIESFDISNISGTDTVASMVVFHDGVPKKSEYKRFQIRDLAGQDDYAAMRQAVTRRFTHYKNGDKGFDRKPELLLIDGGVAHACTALEALQALELEIPVFGMVKDDRHRTRALVTPEGQEIRIDNNQGVFALIGRIQEETHRFAVTYHRQLRSKRLRYSRLDGIAGIGPVRKELLLKQFRSLSAIGQASLEELERLLPRDAAAAVYRHFHSE